MKKITTILCLGVLALQSQNSRFNSVASEIINDERGNAMIVKFKEQFRVEEKEALAFLNTILYGEDPVVLQVKSQERDELGMVHTRLNIKYNDVLLAEKTVVMHCRDGRLESINGDLQKVSRPVNAFVLNESSALNFALRKVGADKYMWQNTAMEQHMKAVLNDPSFTYFPKAGKTILEINGKLYYAYCFNIYAETPLYRSNVYVNGASGSILAERNVLCTIDVPGTALTKYSGTQTIICNQTPSGVHELRDFTRGLGVETFNMGNTTTYIASPSFTNPTAAWTTTTANQAGTDAHWGAEKTYDYYFFEHNRNSINNAGQKLLSYVHYGTNYTNAFWDGQRMTYGDGNGGSLKVFTALDICGHEITHGLTGNTAGLIYSNESGALNESFSDIFGACIENYARPSNWNWKVGEDMTSSNNGLRNMANPALFSDPDTYGGQYWYTGTADNGGVHTNSGVGNFWFYLLTVGGAGTNDLSNTYSVQALGITDAASIAFRALTVYFTPSTDYANARALTIQAAIDLFGTCSNEMIQTMNAWHAVGVGAKYVPNTLNPNFIGDNLVFCTLPATVNFNNTSGFGLSYQWSFGDGGTAVSINATHTYTNSGNFNVKLKATGCNAFSDSIVKTAYVSISIPPTPVAGNVSGCENQPLVLNANGQDILKWFGDAAGSQYLGSGASFTTGPLTSNSTYYVANTIPNAPVFGGLLSFTGGGNLANSAQWQVFNVVQNCTLSSVEVFASSAGTRTIELRNSANQTLMSYTQNLVVGANTVNLNFPLNVGSNYRLALALNSTANLYRSNTGVSYPYNIGGAISIINSSAGAGFYYWFYKWEVVKEDCKSPLVPVNVSINPAPSVSLTLPATEVCKDDELNLAGGVPAGGAYSGSGVNGQVFNGSMLSAGIQTITYSYTAANGCSNSESKVLVTSECTGIDRQSGLQMAEIYPNPVSSELHLTSLPASTRVEVSDLSGRSILLIENASDEIWIPVESWSKGLYFIRLTVRESPPTVFKIVKE